MSQDRDLKVMTVALRAGALMLESSVSVSEVHTALRRITDAYGLDRCEISITLNTITLNYVPAEADTPLTLLRVVDIRDPQPNRLIELEDLSRRIEDGECQLDDADHQLDEIRERPSPHPFWARYVAGVVAAGAWVVFVNGNGWSAAAGVAAATLVVILVRGVNRTRVPEIFATFTAALVVVAVPYFFAWLDVPIRVAPAVVGGLYPLLPGYALVASVVDGLSGAPISSLAKGLQAAMVAVGLALGVLVAIRGAEFLDIVPQNDNAGWPAWVTALSAALAMGALAFSRGTPIRALAPTVVLGVAAWFVLWAAPGHIAPEAATFVGAVLVGGGGAVAARVQRGAATVYTSVAVLVLVPGFTIYLAMFSFAQNATEAGVNLTVEALQLALAIAAGVALGAAIGRSVPRPRPPVGLWRRRNGQPATSREVSGSG